MVTNPQGRQELLRRKLGHARASVVPRPDKATAPLTPAEQRMWLHQQLHPSSSAYNVCILIHLDGDVDEERLTQALNEVVDRHEVLRSTYAVGNDAEPFQRIHPNLPPPINVSESSEPHSIAHKVASTPYDLEVEGPLRVNLVRLSPTRRALIITVHHIAWDGGCFGVLSTELSAIYRGLQPPHLTTQVGDIAAHQAQQSRVIEGQHEEQMAYWRSRLTPPPPALSLPVASTSRSDVSERAHRRDRQMSVQATSSLRVLAATHRTTAFSVFISAYALLLSRWCGETDIAIGTMIANRHQHGTGKLLGNFGNTVILRIDVGGDPDFSELLERTTRIVTEALSNADVPFERLVEELEPAREQGRSAFSDALGLFLERDIQGPELPNVDVRWDNVFNGSSPFALTFQGFLTGDNLRAECTFQTDLLDERTADHMLEHLESLLEAAGTSPQLPCSQIANLPPGQDALVRRLGVGREVCDSDKTVLDYWRGHVEVEPDRVSLVHRHRRYSYAQIDESANVVARRLVSLGLERNGVVAVAAKRSKHTLSAPLAIWKCGGVYLPLDPSQPAARLNAILSQAGVSIVIRDPDVDTGEIPALIISDLETSGQTPASDPGYQPCRLEAAHIGLTSGSTGIPKVVVTTHDSLIARAAWVADEWPGGAGHTRIAKSVPTAIDATAELCEAVVTGETIVLAADDEATDATTLTRLLEEESIGHFQTIPGLLKACATVAPSTIAGCDRVISTGEPLLSSVARSLHESAPGLRLQNSYGCTETAGDVVAGLVTHGDAQRGNIPAGSPLPGSRCYVLSADLDHAPPGAFGELYVGGRQLARGYLGNPSGTAARFIASPFVQSERLYRTGDLARWREDGQLELIGRNDEQVNVRGFRVNIVETADALNLLSGVQEAVVVPLQTATTTELVAYVAGDKLTAEDGPRIRADAAHTLQSAAVPASVIVLERLPRLAGGKVDKAALPAATADDPQRPVRGARNERERELVGLMAKVLARTAIGIDDDFFALGGDSLAAVSFAARANAAGTGFPASAVFRYPTVAQLARQFPFAVNQSAVKVTLPPHVHRFRLSGVDPSSFVTWETLSGSVSTDHLREALDAAGAKYATLRRAISTRGKLWRGKKLTQPEFSYKVVDAYEADPVAALESARAAIDLARGRVVVLLNTAEVPVLVAHPAAIDGTSLTRLAREIESGAVTESEVAAQTSSTIPTIAHAMDSFAESNWDEIFGNGATSGWWIKANQPSSEPRIRAQLKVTKLSDRLLLEALLRTLHMYAAEETLFADVEVERDTPGPLLTMPLAIRGDAKISFGDPSEFDAFLSKVRPTVGWPGILIRRGTGSPNWDPVCTARGTDRLYRLVVGWQSDDLFSTIEVAAEDEKTTQEILKAWAEGTKATGTAEPIWPVS